MTCDYCRKEGVEVFEVQGDEARVFGIGDGGHGFVCDDCLTLGELVGVLVEGGAE